MNKQGLEFEMMGKIILWLALLIALVIVVAAISGHFNIFAGKLKFLSFLD